MARRETAARRYAEAAFELGRSDESLDAWAEDLGRLREALASPQVETVVRHPAIAFDGSRSSSDGSWGMASPRRRSTWSFS